MPKMPSVGSQGSFLKSALESAGVKAKCLKCQVAYEESLLAAAICQAANQCDRSCLINSPTLNW